MDGNERKEGIRRIQLAQLRLIHIFVDICEMLHLRYYMIGGTMLGAIRHKGFIPWDDDADFGMPRPDYEKFVLQAGEHVPDDVELLTFDPPGSYLCSARINDKKCKMLSCGGRNKQVFNIGIDILPQDGLPDNKLAITVYKYNVLFRRALVRLSVFDEAVNVSGHHHEWYKRLIIFIALHVPIEKMLSPQKRWKSLEKALKKYQYDESTYLVDALGGYPFYREMFRISDFGEGALYEFEGLQLCGPKNYEVYLRQLYGDYMTPPPENERNWHDTELILSENTD